MDEGQSGNNNLKNTSFITYWPMPLSLSIQVQYIFSMG